VSGEAVVRDGRIGAITIGDPKGPNATNFNRTSYDVWDVGSGESKAVCFARRVHGQDPTQLIYVAAEGFSEDNLSEYFYPDESVLPVSLVVEAIDDIEMKVRLLETARDWGFPVIQIADVGSKAMLTMNSPGDKVRRRSLFPGVADEELARLMKKDFMMAAANMSGWENVLHDEAGEFILKKTGTPFHGLTPQLGSTTQVAAGLVAEQGLRFLLNRNEAGEFVCRRLVLDKKNCRFKKYRVASVKGKVLGQVVKILGDRGKNN
jgi:hypothetical protein